MSTLINTECPLLRPNMHSAAGAGETTNAVQTKNSGQDLSVLERAGSRVHVGRGQTIFSEGDASEKIYQVVEGAVRRSRHLPDGRRQITDFLLPGDFVGLDNEDVYGFSAEAVAATVLIAWRRPQFMHLADSNPVLGQRLVAQLQRNLREMESHLAVLGRQFALQRVAWFLLYWSERIGSQHGAIELMIKRADIADFLGLTIESVSRNITELRRARIIQIVKDGIHVLDLRKLQMLADSGADTQAMFAYPARTRAHRIH